MKGLTAVKRLDFILVEKGCHYFCRISAVIKLRNWDLLYHRIFAVLTTSQR